MKHLRNSQEIVEKFSCINMKFSMLVLNNHFNFVIMKVIENIKRIRLEKGIPQKLLADALSVDDSVISNIEKGKRELKVSELEIIAKCLGVEVIDLFTYPQKYVPEGKEPDDIEAILQIRLKKDRKEQVLKLVFGDNNLEILNR